MSAHGIPGALRVGRVKSTGPAFVRVAWGRNWDWKPGGKMADVGWGGVEIVTRKAGADFAKRFVEILTGEGEGRLPSFRLGPDVTSARWERKIGEWVYFIEVSPEEGLAPLNLTLATRAALAMEAIRDGV